VEELQKLAAAKEKMPYGFQLYRADEQGGYQPGTQLFGETDPRTKGLMGAIVNYGLPIAVGAVTGGLGFLPAMAASGAASGVAKLMTGYTPEDAAKAAAIAAATRGVMKGTGLEDTLGKFLAAKGSAVTSSAIPAGALSGAPMSVIPAGALGGASASAIPAGAFSGLGSAAAGAVPEIIVTAAKNALTSAVPGAFSGAAASGFDQFLSDNAGMVGDGMAETPAKDEIVVTSQPPPKFDFTGGLATIPASVLLSQTPPVVDPGDIVVTGQKIKPDDIGGKPTDLLSPVMGEFVASDIVGGGKSLEQEQAEKDGKGGTLDKIADAATIAGLVIPAIGALAGGGGKGGTGTYTSGAGALNPIFSGKLPTPGEGGAFTVGGLGPATGPNPLAARPTADWYRYAMGPAMDIPAGMDLSGATSPYAGFGPGTLGRETFNRVTGLEVPPRPTGFEVAPSPTGDLTNRKVGETKVVDGDTYVWGGNQNGWQRQYKDPTTGEIKLFSGNGATSVTSLADMLASGMATQRPANQPFFKQNLTNIPDWANTYRNWQNAMRGAGVPEAERSAAEREFMTALEQRPFANAKELFDFARGLLDRSRRPKAAARGGPMGYSRGSSRESFAVEGPGTGRSDDIPAVLSDGEYVIDAETVALLGDGSSRAGAKKLDELRVKVRKHKGKNLAAGKFSVNAKNPEAYMRGGRI
jgi:hypothetical protein